MVSFRLDPRPGNTVSVAGLELHYETLGDAGRPVLLALHGALASTEAWRASAERLGREFRLVLLDLPGHGYSERNDGFSQGLPEQAEVVVEFMSQIGLGRVHLMGQSMGGAIAVLVAARRPDRVERLVLVDAVSYPFDLPLTGRLVLVPVLGRFLIGRLFNRKSMSNFVRNDVFWDASRVSERQIDVRFAHFDEPASRRAAHRTLKALQRIHWLAAEFPRVEAPTLVVWGTRDPMFPAEHGRRLAADIAGAELRLIEDCGHEPMNERPEEFCDTVLEFLTSERPRTTAPGGAC